MQLNIPNNFISKFNVMVIAMQNLQFLKKEGKNIITSRFLVYSMVQPCNHVLTAFCNKNARFFKKSVLIYHYVPFQSWYVYINCNIRDLPLLKKKPARHVFFLEFVQKMSSTVVEALTILLASSGRSKRVKTE